MRRRNTITNDLRDELSKALRAGRLSEALALYELIEKRKPEEPRWPHRKGDLLHRMGRRGDAVVAYERAIQLYATGIADAVLEGKESVPTVVAGEDEFVELDETGNPRKKTTRGKPKPAAVRTRKPPARRRVPPVKAQTETETGTGTGTGTETAESGGDEESLEGEVPEVAASGGSGTTPASTARRPGGAARRKTRG